MISKGTLKPFIWAINIGNFFRSIPYLWDANVGRTHMYSSGTRKNDLLNYWISICCIYIQIVGHIGMIVFFVGIILVSDGMKPSEIICGILFANIFLLSISCHVANGFDNPTFMTYLNSLLNLNDVYGQSFLIISIIFIVN